MWYIIGIPLALLIIWKVKAWEDKKQMEEIERDERNKEREREHANSLVGLSIRQTELKQELKNVDRGLEILAENAKKKKDAS